MVFVVYNNVANNNFKGIESILRGYPWSSTCGTHPYSDIQVTTKIYRKIGLKFTSQEDVWE